MDSEENDELISRLLGTSIKKNDNDQFNLNERLANLTPEEIKEFEKVFKSF